MPYGLIDYDTLKNIARAIRYKANTNRDYRPRDMAQAINTIKSGGGVDEPFIPSLSNFKANNSDNNIYQFYSAIDFEFINQQPNYEDPTFRLFGVESWPGVSPSDVMCYARSGAVQKLLINNANFMGFVTNTYNSYTDIWNNSREGHIEVNGNEFYAKIGDVVLNKHQQCYMVWCNNMLYNYSTGLFETGWAGLGDYGYANNISMTQGLPYSNNGNLYYDLHGLIYGFSYDSSFNENQFSIMDMTQLFAGCGNLVTAFSGKYTRYMINTFYSCQGITRAACGPSVENMYNCYASCNGLRGEAACGNNVVSMNNAYIYCNNIETANIGPKVKYGLNAYEYCHKVRSIKGNAYSLMHGFNMFHGCENLQTVNTNLDNLFNGVCMFYGCSNLQQVPNELPMLMYGNAMFYGCSNLMMLPSCPNLIRADGMFLYANNLTTEQIQNFIDSAVKLEHLDSVFNFGTYASGANLLNLVFPERIKSINSLFSGNQSYNSGIYNETTNNYDWLPWITGQAVCPDTVYEITNTYAYDFELTDAACGNSVVNMNGSYRNCYNLVNAACGPNVIAMNFTYENCNNLTTAVCGDNVLYMVNTYVNCTNLTKPVCGNNVTDMWYTYGNCNLINEPVCGDNVINFQSVYRNMPLIVNPVCGNNVVHMNGTYSNCPNIVNAVCGPNVCYMEGTYDNCGNIINPACGENVWVMNYTYNNCQNVETAVIGNNVRQMVWSYQHCGKITDVVIPKTMANMFMTFNNCRNLVNVYLAGNYNNTRTDVPEVLRNTQSYIGLTVPFTNCYNIVNIQFDPDLEGNLGSSTFANMRKITFVPEFPPRIERINYMFNNCDNIVSDIVLNCPSLMFMENAFRNCYKIQNIFVDGSNLYNNLYSVRNAFYRYPNSAAIANRRNIVVANYEGWNKMVYWNCAGNYAKTNETYAEPVEVNVNGITYNCVRCSYNTANNIYIYCME